MGAIAMSPTKSCESIIDQTVGNTDDRRWKGLFFCFKVFGTVERFDKQRSTL